MDTKLPTHMHGWRRFLNPTPTREMFNEAWILLFGYHPMECQVSTHVDGRNTGFNVITPKGVHCHGGFGYHTDHPILLNPTDEWYIGAGCTWGVDKVGQRFYYLDIETGLPRDWDKIRAVETIRSFIKNNKQPIEKLIAQCI